MKTKYNNEDIRVYKERSIEILSNLLVKENSELLSIKRGDFVSVSNIEKDELYVLQLPKDKVPLTKNGLVSLSSMVKFGIIKEGDEVCFKKWKGKVVRAEKNEVFLQNKRNAGQKFKSAYLLVKDYFKNKFNLHGNEIRRLRIGGKSWNDLNVDLQQFLVRYKLNNIATILVVGAAISLALDKISNNMTASNLDELDLIGQLDVMSKTLPAASQKPIKQDSFDLLELSYNASVRLMAQVNSDLCTTEENNIWKEFYNSNLPRKFPARNPEEEEEINIDDYFDPNFSRDWNINK